MPRRKFGWVGAVLGAGAGAIGCSTSEPLRLDGSLKLDGSMAVSLEGPIEMKLQGPVLEYEGTFISAELYEAVELDRTQMEWVLAAFGEPDDERALGPSELWVWRYRAAAVQGSPVKIMSLGTGEDAAPASMTVILEITNGIVTRKWRG